jgi:branched-chain amino acid aminotransferase
VNSFLARRTAEKSGFDDGLMFDRDGHLTEASAANVFLIADGRLVTPRLKPDVFPGITRQVVLELASCNGIETQQADLLRADLAEIDGAIVCSTLMEIRALSRLGERPLPTAELSVYSSLVNSFRNMTQQ